MTWSTRVKGRADPNANVSEVDRSFMDFAGARHRIEAP